MDFNVVQILLVAVFAFIAGIDQYNFLESLYQPIVSGAVIGAILGDLQTGLIVGGTYQLMTIGNMPVGGAQPPNPVIGGIMAVVFVTLLFTVMSPLMSKADKYAENADTKGLERLNYLAMAALGLFFAVVVVAGLLGGSALGTTLSNLSDKYSWFMDGLSAAGGMMRYVGFAILLRIMLSKDLWGIYFGGFALATIIGSIESLAGSALLLIAFIGIAIAVYDFQTNVKIKSTAGEISVRGGDDEDGI